MLVVMCKNHNLPAGHPLHTGETYEVLDERHWGFRLKVGGKAEWYDRVWFTVPQKVPLDD